MTDAAPSTTQQKPPATEKAWLIPIVLLPVACLDIFILHEESLYLPLGRYPGSESLPDGCMLIPMLSLAALASLITAGLDAAPKRRRFLCPVYIAIALAVLGSPLISPAYRIGP
jgi:hypothetical protein